MSAVAKILLKLGARDLKYEFTNGDMMVMTMASLREVNSANVATGTIKTIADHCRHKNESAYQFNLDDVVRISDPKSGVALFEKSDG